MVSNEKDPEYATYASVYKATARILNTQATLKSFSDQIRQVRERFPYFERTNPKIMAIAMYVAVSEPDMSNGSIMDLITRVFPSSQLKNKDSGPLLIDVKRYIKRLTTD